MVFMYKQRLFRFQAVEQSPPLHALLQPSLFWVMWRGSPLFSNRLCVFAFIGAYLSVFSGLSSLTSLGLIYMVNSFFGQVFCVLISLDIKCGSFEEITAFGSV